jgi:hypothetical protein
MISVLEIIVIVILCGGCFVIWAECFELCDCCDNINCCHKDTPDINTKGNIDKNIETNRELQISTYTITSPIQSKCVEI